MPRILAVSALVALVAGCPGRDVEVLEVQPETNDHGRADLIELVEGHAAKPPSPQAFAAFVDRLDQLRPRFNEEIEDLAELYLAFFAVQAVESVADLPRAERFDALALTVFPTAFEVAPEPGETVRDYMLRLCGEVQPLECKDWVPEGWPVVMAAKARRLLKHRAQEALSACTTCPDEDVFTEVLERYSDKVADADAYAKEREGEYLPGRWPMAADHAAPWRERSLFALVDGVASIDGEPLPPGSWHRALAKRRGDARVLGVHLEPDDRVETLRVIGKDAARAGYHELALQVRVPHFPYPLREYRLALRGGGRRIDVRDIDTIQILARALDARWASSDVPPRL